jgi:hypothetical protein
MPITARDIITRSLQKIGALTKNEAPAADEANDGLNSLNALISSWSNDSLNIYARTWETFSLTGATSYTIGTGGNFNTARPTNIVAAYLRSGTIDYPITIIDDSAYVSISYKNLQGIPEFLNYDNAYPLGRIRLYPLDNASYSLFLLTEKSVTSFATLDTDMSLPDGWERALIYNLALELAPEYSQKPDAYIVKIANDSLGAIRQKVAQVRGMDAYPNNLAVRNIFSGWRY